MLVVLLPCLLGISPQPMNNTPTPMVCTADFTSDATSICAGDSVTFTDNSQGAISYYQWIFEGGTPSEAKGAGPHTVIYSTPGTYDVILTIACREGDDSITKKNYITVNDCSCIANFFADDTIGCAPMKVTFTDYSTGAVAWSWSFTGGSPSTATGQGPHAVTYATPGSYDVSLAIRCGNSSDTETKRKYISARECTCDADFSSDPDGVCAPVTVVFTDQSTNAQQWNWTFSGGSPSSATGLGPHTVIYSTPGEYDVKLDIVCVTGEKNSETKVDYVEVDDCMEKDWGDAPDPTYPTYAKHNGASHVVESGFHLGQNIDIEPDGQPNATATGDDAGTVDDDGVYFLKLIPGQPGKAMVYASQKGIINGWIDFNADGDWADSGEQIWTALPKAALWDTLFFNIPTDAKPGSTYARVRLSTTRSLSYTGAAPDGEVEDYLLEIDSDTPQPGTLLIPFRSCIELELQSPTGGSEKVTMSGPATAAVYINKSGLASDHDGNGLDDVKAKLIYLNLVGTSPTFGTITLSLNPYKSSMGQVEETANSTPGVLDIPPYTAAGSAMASFAASIKLEIGGNSYFASSLIEFFTTLTALPPISATLEPLATTMTVDLLDDSGRPTGYQIISISPCSSTGGEYDFGDAPDPLYPTFLSSNGARHIIVKGYYLGSDVDGEPDGQSSASANGDDVNGSDDEDGVTVLSPLTPGMGCLFQISVSDSGYISGGVDCNADGDWDDSGEFLCIPVRKPGVLWVYPIPATAKPGPTFARFRFSHQAGLMATGLARDGEVEDYQVRIEPEGIQPRPYPFEHKICLTMDMYLFGLGHIRTQVAGMLLEHVFFEGGSAGTANDDNGNGRDEVVTQLMTLDLTGVDPLVGTVKVSLHPTLPSWGLMEENANSTPGILDLPPYTATGSVESFFDVFFQITLPDIGMVLQTNASKKLEGTLYHLPPSTDDVYAEALPDSVGLYSTSGNKLVGQLKTLAACGTTTLSDFGDAPLTYDPGPSHFQLAVNKSVHLGKAIDSEPSYQADSHALGDDNNNIDDEDGIAFTSPLVQGQNAKVQVDLSHVTSSTFKIHANIDFDGDGQWSAAEEILAGETWTAGIINTKTFPVPATAKPGITFARFYIIDTGPTPASGLPYGEVEDYEIWIGAREENYDWGDAPDPTYPTLMASNGAVHVIKKGLHMGLTIDAEKDGQPKPDADGDDLNNLDDEDGVSFSVLTPGHTGNITITASDTGAVNAWIDFDGDGSWSGSGEQILIATRVYPGSNTFSFMVPAAANQGPAYARIRFSSQRQLSYWGWAPDGEVEDYVVKIGEGEGEYDWGDLPAPYKTLRKDNGPYHLIDPGVRIGSLVDAEQDGLPEINALGDDNNNTDDEEGVLITTLSNTTLIIKIPSYLGGEIYAWVDLNQDGDLTNDISAGAGGGGGGGFSLSVWNPGGYTPGKYYARIRAYKNWNPSPSPVGYGGPGEVEDHAFEFRIEDVAYDYGDAPAPYPTKLTPTSDGWRHPIKLGVHLGSAIDAEPDGQPDADAQGDDLHGVNDEDGVVTASPLVPGITTFLQVSASTKGFLNAWIDYNQDGDWSDGGEQIFSEIALNAGINPLSFTVPGTALPGKTFARLRFSSQKLSFDPVHNLYIAMDGEVEDYQANIMDPKTGAVGDGVWHDSNANGLQDAGEPGAGGVTVELYDSGGALKGSTVTDPAGHYYFTSLAPGKYFVKFILPAGLVFSPADQGIDDNIDSDANPTTGSTPIFLLSAGEINLSLDAGLVRAIQEGDFDFGDAPDPTYPTLLVNNGARHKILKGMYLGTGIDPDLDGQPMADAGGDDCDGFDDEDGVVFPAAWPPGSSVNLQVTAAGVPAGAIAYLNAWADYNANGLWSDPGEQIVVNQPVVNGINNIPIAVPPGVAPGGTFARFRYSSAKNLSFDDAAPDGEVEDYPIFIGERPRNWIGDLVWYDSNQNGLQDISESGLAGVPVRLINTANTFVASTVTNVFGFYAFSNLAADTYFLEFGALAGYNLSLKDQGLNDLLDSDADPATGRTDPFPVGMTTIDKSRDAGMHRTLQEGNFDFGDAPDPTYPTLHAHGGAYHIIVPGFHLGAGVDAEKDGQPSAHADGDDADGNDDEDGVTFTSALIPGNIAHVTVVASQPGLLNAWIDFNCDGDWADGDDRIYCDVAVGAGVNAMTFLVPPTAVTGVSFARFRLSKQGGLSYTGMASDGEVEDYEITLGEGGGQSFYKWQQWPLKWNTINKPDCYQGWDEPSVMGIQLVADDWFCNDHRPVTDIHWWGSYLDWREDNAPEVAPIGFHIGIWSDVPAGIDQPFSHPQRLIWEFAVDRIALEEKPVGCDFMPEREMMPETCFSYHLVLPVDHWFIQEGDSSTYWISIAAIYENPPEKHIWGWKTRRHYFNDDAIHIVEPKVIKLGVGYRLGEPLPHGWDMAFLLTTNLRATIYDFGDAPDPLYPTLLLSNGAHHLYNPAVYIGKKIDSEPDGLPNNAALGDDASSSDDEDGVHFTSPLVPGKTATAEVLASCSGYLQAWIDYDGDQSWNGADEQVLIDQPTVAGVNSYSFKVPVNVSAMRLFTRFRFSTVKGLSYEGCAIDGEVEDHMVNLAPSAVESHGQETPKTYKLEQNYPNPFNPSTSIVFELPRTEKVQLAVYDLLGHQIRMLTNDSRKAGTHTVIWDARDDQDRPVPSGIYLYRLTAGPFTQMKKMLLLK